MDFKYIHLKTIDSTNEYAKKHYQVDSLPLLIHADEQTHGKGQMGKSFYSPPGKGLYMSLVLNFEQDIERLQTLNLEIGHVLSDLLNQLFKIKTKAVYPNDVMIQERKLAGILTEGIYNIKTKTYDCIVIGLGLNILESPHPDLNAIKISLAEVTKQKIEQEKLMLQIATAIYRHLKEIS